MPTSLGAAEDSVGLPTATWSLENYTVAEYEELLASVKSGSFTVDNDFSKLETTDWSNLTLTVI